MRAGRSDIVPGLSGRAGAPYIVHVFVPVRLNPVFLFSKDIRDDFSKRLSLHCAAMQVDFCRDF
ncbi:protein of unknown function (plasmid) [Caballeronia sp. S22]